MFGETQSREFIGLNGFRKVEMNEQQRILFRCVHSFFFATANFQDLASSHEQILLERFMFLRLLYQEIAHRIFCKI